MSQATTARAGRAGFRQPDGPWRRTLLAVLLVVSGAALVSGFRGYRALCQGPVDLYPSLATARTDAAQAAANAPTPAAVTARASHDALEVVIAIKQSDYVAFPGHVVAGAILQSTGCPVSATGDQWRKAASHAWFDAAAWLAAHGLHASMGVAGSDTATLAMLRSFAADEPWHAANLERVEQEYETLLQP